ncbi:MAG: SET domain-containing protein [Parachlamydiales bacterium]|nr:SET domain-containing protein [Parachlamydiales bacterium]
MTISKISSPQNTTALFSNPPFSVTNLEEIMRTSPFLLPGKVLSWIAPAGKLDLRCLHFISPRKISSLQAVFLVDCDNFLPRITSIMNNALQSASQESLLQIQQQLSNTTSSGETFLHLAALHSSNRYQEALQFFRTFSEQIFPLSPLDSFINQKNAWNMTARDLILITSVPPHNFSFMTNESDCIQKTSEDFKHMTNASFVTTVVFNRQRLREKWSSNIGSFSFPFILETALFSSFTQYHSSPFLQTVPETIALFSHPQLQGHYGVTAIQAISQGRILCLYEGKEENTLPENLNPYITTIANRTFLNAQKYRGLGGMINHGFPNVTRIPFFWSSLFETVAFHAVEPIPAQEELLYNYHAPYQIKIVMGITYQELGKERLKNYLSRLISIHKRFENPLLQEFLTITSKIFNLRSKILYTLASINPSLEKGLNFEELCSLEEQLQQAYPDILKKYIGLLGRKEKLRYLLFNPLSLLYAFLHHQNNFSAEKIQKVYQKIFRSDQEIMARNLRFTEMKKKMLSKTFLVIQDICRFFNTVANNDLYEQIFAQEGKSFIEIMQLTIQYLSPSQED